MDRIKCEHRVTSTVSGCDFSEMKSSVQKAIRREDLKVAQSAIMEGLSLQLAKNANPTVKKAKLTNLLNRLIISAFEDTFQMGIFKDLEACICDVDSARARDDNNNNMEIVCRSMSKMAAILCAAKKGRLPSIVKIFALKDVPSGFVSKYPVLASSSMTFGELVAAKDLRAVRCLDKETEASVWPVLKTEVAKYFPEKSHPFHEDLVSIENIWKALYKKKHRESYIIVYHALAMLVLRDDDERGRDEMSIETFETFEHYIDKVCTTEYKFVPPDYAIDVHTAKGKMQGKTTMDFAIDGSFVKDELLISSGFRPMYIDSKKLYCEGFKLDQQPIRMNPRRGRSMPRKKGSDSDVASLLQKKIK